MNPLFFLASPKGQAENAFATVNGLERAERYVLQQEQLAGCRPLPLFAHPRPECQLFSEEERVTSGRLPSDSIVPRAPFIEKAVSQSGSVGGYVSVCLPRSFGLPPDLSLDNMFDTSQLPQLG